MRKHCLIKILVLALSVASISFAADCPIIFVHGQKGGKDAHPKVAWWAWNGSGYKLEGDPKPYRTAMDKIRIEGYGGYTPGEPFNCDKDSVPQHTGGETRKIYNFSYYNPDGSRGVIGSNGHILPEDYKDWRTKYEESLDNASWAEHLAKFIEKVLEACYGPNWFKNPDAKVDIVAHCMGGLVARAAIRWYELRPGRPCSLHVRKLLTIATPHNGCHFRGECNIVQKWAAGHSDWQTHGEDLEMNVDPSYFKDNVLFVSTKPPYEERYYYEWLGNYDCGVKTATISGNRPGDKSILIEGEDDNMIATWWAKFLDAQYNPTVYASHSVGDFAYNSNETFLTGCTFTTEFIKRWMIDDSEEQKGAVCQHPESPQDSIYPVTWIRWEGRVQPDINDYKKALVTSIIIFDLLGQVHKMIGIPIYKYDKGKEPAIALWPYDLVPYQAYWLYDLRNYDLNGLINKRSFAFIFWETAYTQKAYVEIVDPKGGMEFKGGSHYSIRWHWGYHHVIDQKMYLTVDGEHYYELENYQIKEFDTILRWWEVPGVNSDKCRLRLVAWLDPYKKISHTTDPFRVYLERPEDLKVWEVNEEYVWLIWSGGGPTSIG